MNAPSSGAVTLVSKFRYDFWLDNTDGPLSPRVGMLHSGRVIECPRLRQLQIGVGMTEFLRRAWRQEVGQDVAEYAVMLAVILAIAIGTIRLIGSHAGSVFANVGSAIQ